MITRADHTWNATAHIGLESVPQLAIHNVKHIHTGCND